MRAAKPTNKSGHVGRKEVTDPTPPADDATKLNKEPVDVETPEEKEAFEEAPVAEPAEDKDEDTTQMMGEETEAGDAANDMQEADMEDEDIAKVINVFVFQFYNGIVDEEIDNKVIESTKVSQSPIDVIDDVKDKTKEIPKLKIDALES